MSTVFLQISALVGHDTLTDADDETRELYHRRFQELFEKCAKQIETLSKLILERTREAPEMARRASATIEEQSLSVPYSGDREMARPEKDRGHER